MWHELATAICLLLIIEGMLPFLAPAKWRSLVVRLAEAGDASMRLAGFVSMIMGVALLYFVRY